MHGKSSTNYYGYFKYALNGLLKHSHAPQKIAAVLGVIMALFSLVYAVIQLGLVLFYANTAQPGIPTLIIGLFFLSGIQLLMLGIIGETLRTILKESRRFPLVVERERINFSEDT